MYILLIVPFEYKLAVGFYAYTLYIQHSARTEICYFFFLFLIRGIFSRFFVSIDKQDVVDSAFCGASCLFPLLCT